MPAFTGLPEEKLVDHAWLEGNRLVVIQESQIHIMSAEELQVIRTIEPSGFRAPFAGRLRSPFGEADLDDQVLVPMCLRSFTGGFLVGGSEGYVAVWEMEDAEGESLKSVDEEYHLSTSAKASGLACTAYTHTILIRIVYRY